MNKGGKSDWLTLKTSVFKLFRVAIYIINSVDDTK